MAKTPATESVEYRVLVGMDLFNPKTKLGTRVEAGDVVTDIVPDDVEWLLAGRYIAVVGTEDDVVPATTRPISDKMAEVTKVPGEKDGE